MDTKRIAKQKANESLDELFTRSNLIRNGKDFKQLLDFVARFKSYKPYNNFLVYMQNPACKYYATTKDWQNKFSRKPKQDARPMIILAPMHPVLFVYDLDDTEGEPLPNLLDDLFNVNGHYSDVYFRNVVSYFESLNLTLYHKTFSSRQAGKIVRINKNADPVIEINKDLPPAALFATVLHELAHLFMGHLGSTDYEKHPIRNDIVMQNVALREMEAEGVTYLVLSRLGLETKSAEYLAFYNAKPEDLKKISVDLVLKIATKLEEMVMYKCSKASCDVQGVLFEK